VVEVVAQVILGQLVLLDLEHKVLLGLLALEVVEVAAQVILDLLALQVLLGLLDLEQKVLLGLLV
jgi:hypothetical protein